MPGKTARQGVKAYIDPLQKNVSIVSKGVLRASEYDNIDRPGVLTLPDPVPLNGRTDLFLSFTQQYKIIRDPNHGLYRVTTRYYAYKVEGSGGGEIFGYHWHPEGPSPIKIPHLHLGQAVQLGVGLSRKNHFPTGRIAFEELVEFLITEFGVKPNRKLWQELVARTKSAFHKDKTW